MATIILKNQTAGQKTYGVVVVPASGQRSVGDLVDVLKNKDTLFTDIVSGDIIVNDGTSDLNADEGRSILLNSLDEQPIYVRGTGALALPAGTTAERPTVVVDGMIRYNSTTNKYEICENSSWKDISAALQKHDRQTGIATSGTSTAQQTYQDLDSATLTTKNLGETGTYDISFSCVATHSGKGDVGFVINIGGVDEPVTERLPKLSSDNTEVNMMCQKSGLASGTVIKVRYKAVDAGTVDVNNRALFVAGVPDSTVVS